MRLVSLFLKMPDFYWKKINSLPKYIEFYCYIKDRLDVLLICIIGKKILVSSFMADNLYRAIN